MIKAFTIDNISKKIISCPAGHSPIESEYSKSKKHFYARFSATNCFKCAFKTRCSHKLKNNKFSIVRVTEDNLDLRVGLETKEKLSLLLSNKYWHANSVSMPDTIEGIKVTEIAEETFFNSPIRKVILPDTVKTIKRSAFADCKNLTEIVIPDSVAAIENFAFSGCSSLKKIVLSDNVTKIGSHAFDECISLETVKLPTKIGYIGAYTFSETAITEIEIPAGIKYLGNSLFYNCKRLQKVILSEGIETIGLYTFAKCSELKEVMLPDSVRIICNVSFSGCTSLRHIRLPRNLQEMHYSSFSNCINLELVETDSIYKKVVVFNHNKKMDEMIGMNPTDKDEYDTVYNMLQPNTQKHIKVRVLKKEIESIRNSETILNEGVQLKHEGKYIEARDKYIEAIKLDPQNATPYYNLGKILYILQEYNTSARSYKTAYELGASVGVLVHLGHSLIDEENKTGRFKNVVAFYQRGINPFLLKNAAKNLDEYRRLIKINTNKDEMDEYDRKCVVAAKVFLAEA